MHSDTHIESHRVIFAAWKRRAAGYAGLAVLALLLLGFVVSFLKTLFYGLALVCVGYLFWVLTRKGPTPLGNDDPVLDGPGPLLRPQPHADAQARLNEIHPQRNA